jgi:hypothetical protein
MDAGALIGAYRWVMFAAAALAALSAVTAGLTIGVGKQHKPPH